MEQTDRKQTYDFTHGSVLKPLLRFMLPVLAALLIQSLYSSVDLMIVGQFGTAVNVSGVSVGGGLTFMVQMFITALSMGSTILLGQYLGEKRKEEAGRVVGTTVILFAGIALAFMILLFALAVPMLQLLQTPSEALAEGTAYVRICSIGMLFIVAYNVSGSIFRGIGDSRTPLIAVAVACVVNIAGDLLLVGVFHMAAAGAAIATVFAQAVSVAISLFLIRKKGMPFPFGKENLHLDASIAKAVFRLGAPLAIQEIVISISFLVVASITNQLGVVASASAGVAGRLITFIMLLPSAYAQALSAFVAQNIGARRLDRAKKALLHGIWTSLVFATVMFFFSGLHGTWLTSIFTREPEVVTGAAQYLLAYGIDTFLTSFLFCLIGYFNGCGLTRITLIQGAIGVLVRIPAAILISHSSIASLFTIACSTPISTVIQIIFCGIYFFCTREKIKRQYGGS